MKMLLEIFWKMWLVLAARISTSESAPVGPVVWLYLKIHVINLSLSNLKLDPEQTVFLTRVRLLKVSPTLLRPPPDIFSHRKL